MLNPMTTNHNGAEGAEPSGTSDTWGKADLHLGFFFKQHHTFDHQYVDTVHCIHCCR